MEYGRVGQRQIGIKEWGRTAEREAIPILRTSDFDHKDKGNRSWEYTPEQIINNKLIRTLPDPLGPSDGQGLYVVISLWFSKASERGS